MLDRNLVRLFVCSYLSAKVVPVPPPGLEELKVRLTRAAEAAALELLEGEINTDPAWMSRYFPDVDLSLVDEECFIPN